MDYYKIFVDYLEKLKKIEIDRNLALQIASAGAIGLVAIYIGYIILILILIDLHSISISYLKFFKRKIWRSYRFFEKRGIKTPPYKFFYGNLNEIRKEGYSDILVKWTKEYGKTYG